MVRNEVIEFSQLGALPDGDNEEADIALFETRLQNVTPPVNDEEAAMLAHSFGRDDCFGLAWSLLHLIETAPTSPAVSNPDVSDNCWVQLLLQRANKRP